MRLAAKKGRRSTPLGVGRRPFRVPIRVPGLARDYGLR